MVTHVHRPRRLHGAVDSPLAASGARLAGLPPRLLVRPLLQDLLPAPAPASRLLETRLPSARHCATRPDGPRLRLVTRSPRRRMGINSGYLPGAIKQVRENASGHVLVRIAIAILIALFNAAIPEEFFFRYWLQARLEQRFGRIVAITGAALLFTAWHIPSRYFLASGGEGHAGDLGSVLVNTGLPVMLTGLIFGVLWDRHRRPWPLIALHWGIDSLPLTGAILGLHH